jgi:hypothetical protein
MICSEVMFVLDGFSVRSQKATIIFVMSVCLFVRMEQLGSHWTDCNEK